MFDGIRKRWRARRKKKTIDSIKGHMLFFGCDMSDMTDEEIEEIFIKTSETLSKLGCTAKEAVTGLKQLSTAMSVR